MIIDYDAATSYGFAPLVVGGLVAAWTVYSLGVALYNVTFHPLRKFPGPKMSAAFYFPSAYAALNGSREAYSHSLHKKYGPVVRISPSVLSFASGQAWKDIYGFRQGKPQMQKDPTFYVRDPHDKMPRNLILADDAGHASQRRLLANAFSDSALRSQEELLNVYFDLFVSRLQEQIDGPNRGKVDMVGWYNFTTFDIIGDLTFGESFHALENRDYHPWIRNIFKSIKFGRFARLGADYPLFWSFFQTLVSLFPSIRKVRAEHFGFVTNKTRARLDLETDRKDFIHYIKRGKGDHAMTDMEIISNSSLLIIAGSETTATLLSGVTYHLLRNPDKMAKLKAEVRQAFSKPEDMTLVSTGKLPYLHAVLEEGLRMYPPVPAMLQRVVPPSGDFVDGRWVPGNTVVGVHQWSTSHSADNWADPDEFVPERFLSGADLPARYRNDKRDSIQPFSTGPRNCLGKNLAYNEMRSILARAIWHFEMELEPESADWAAQPSWTLWQKPELHVKLTHREKAE